MTQSRPSVVAKAVKLRGVAQCTRRQLLGSVGSAAAASALAGRTVAADGSAGGGPMQITDDLSQLEAQAAAVLDPEGLGYIVASAA